MVSHSFCDIRSRLRLGVKRGPRYLFALSLCDIRSRLWLGVKRGPRYLFALSFCDIRSRLRLGVKRGLAMCSHSRSLEFALAFGSALNERSTLAW